MYQSVGKKIKLKVGLIIFCFSTFYKMKFGISVSSDFGHLYLKPWQLGTHMVQERHTGEYGTHWDKVNKRLTSFKLVNILVGLLPEHLLLSGKN